jgi:dTDP-4-amino-4,6-dideoxygalactose transaminase
MVPPVIKSWLKRVARHAGISRDFPMPLLSEEEFRSLEKVVLSPREGMDAVARFTRNFARYLGVRYGVAVNSGTSALEIAVAAAGIGPGDEVIVPSYSFYSTASAVLKARARPVFVDVRLEDGCIDCEEVRKAATGKTKAVIAVHLAGVPADLDGLLDVCRGRGLTLIEDVAQAVGSEWRGRKLGSFGALGCFSFQASKNLAAGEGGFIATDDERLFSLCSAFSNVGLSPDANEWEHVILGGNYRLPHLEAAILSILLKKVDESIERKEENSAFLTESLKKISGITLLRRPPQATRINHHFYGFRYGKGEFGGMPKGKFISLLQNEGLPCAGGYPSPLYAHPAFSQNLEALSKCFAFCEKAKDLQAGQIHHPNTLKLCAEAAGFEQNFLLGGRKEMEGAVEAIQRLSKQYNGS